MVIVHSFISCYDLVKYYQRFRSLEIQSLVNFQNPCTKIMSMLLLIIYNGMTKLFSSSFPALTGVHQFMCCVTHEVCSTLYIAS